MAGGGLLCHFFYPAGLCPNYAGDGEDETTLLTASGPLTHFSTALLQGQVPHVSLLSPSSPSFLRHLLPRSSQPSPALPSLLHEASIPPYCSLHASGRVGNLHLTKGPGLGNRAPQQGPGTQGSSLIPAPGQTPPIKPQCLPHACGGGGAGLGEHR